MGLRKFAILTSTLVLFCSFAFAQTQPSQTKQPSDPAVDAEKAKKKKELDERVVQMLDQAVSDATGFRLPQNRAIVYALAGDLYWKFDDKRSRELFRNAADEIISYNAETEREVIAMTADGIADAVALMMDPSDPRGDILPLIAKHDAELALELLFQTRSAKLADAMAKVGAPDAKSDVDIIGMSMDKVRVSREMALEQNISKLAAADDPDKLIKLIKDTMAKSVTPGLIQLLQQLNQKDTKKADELGAAVIAKLGDADLAKGQDDMRTALSFLQYAARPAQTPPPKDKPFVFSDAQMKDLANKMMTALLIPSKSMVSTMMITQAMPVLEKFVPEKIALLKQRDAENKKSMPTEFKSSMNIAKIWDPNSTPEELLAQLSKMTNENDKRQVYPALTSKIGQIADEARAKKLIDQIPDEKTRATAQEQFDSAKIGRATAAGKIDEARRLIGALTNRRIQLQRLVALAMQVQRKGTEKDIESAKSMMTDAKALTKDYPDDEDDIADMMEVVKGYTAVEPETAFRIVEPIINEFNDIVQASAVLSKYNKRDRTFKKGELVMKANGGFGGGLLLFRYIPQMQLLGKADLERMSLLSDRFGRSDVRMIVKLFVIRGFLQPDIRPAAPRPSTGTGVVTKF